MLWDPFLYCINDSIQGNSETGNKVFVLPAKVAINTMQYYFRPIREFPTGRGFADFVYIPKPEYKAEYPALVVELKWNKNAQTALQQIHEKKYPSSILSYTGNILLVGISYDKKTKKHECVIEEYQK